MKKIEVKNITLMDDVETKEAESLYYVAKHKYFPPYCFVSLLFFIFLLLTLAGSGDKEDSELFLGLTILFGIVAFLARSIYTSKMKPYKKLLKIAELNDRIRHEERIRENERNRIIDEKKYSTKSIDKTLENTENLDKEKKSDK